MYASVDVIKQAIEKNVNLIIAHESLFWNHGDHTDWLIDNKTYQMKKKMLQDNYITVWRNHDYIHAGILCHGKRVDGIFYGLLKMFGWEKYIDRDIGFPLIIDVPKISTKEFINELMEKLGLNGLKCFGNIDGYTKRIYIPMHITGNDNDKITIVDKENIDTIISMECIDYTLGIYIKDTAMLNIDKCILAVGHFNLEEPGMKWYGEEYLPTILPKSLPIYFIKVSDMYQFQINKGAK
ncbi:Nif3-like dinuclear metal center hexameric protein [Allocoprobacillus halotolerans]|uniref:GTP cyclohydrolase 1 type 2 homolog n=1 Tax=Allocoprobacillus halotolerans TaxID=2944914 RepID=A0ABY5I726_9FIRM|nr:Nif3-like dinuclear metal center hexameric protein [Allocoprobacillus halotolerans]UTY40810.1 Nif3-like dinuclear metal center hexameric protein [Allocoprobacillus halotolerans]